MRFRLRYYYTIRKALQSLSERKALDLGLKTLPTLQQGGSVTLAGPPGVGKTVTACRLARLLEEKRNEGRQHPEEIDGYFLTAMELFAMAIEEKDVYRALKLCDIVIVDDVGMEAPTDFKLSVFDDFVDSRYRQQEATIYTTNLNHIEFQQRYGERVWRRLRPDPEIDSVALGKFIEIPK